MPNFCAICITAENSREISKFYTLSSKLSTGTVERFRLVFGWITLQGRKNHKHLVWGYILRKSDGNKRL